MIQQEKKSFFSKLGGHFKGAMVAGSLTLIPLAITFVLIRWIFTNIDGLLQPYIERFADISIPGLGLLALIVLVYLFGVVWQKRIGRRVVRTAQHIILNIPIIGAIYGPARQLIESFTGESGAGFKRVVVVEYPKQDTWMIGFLTGISQVTPGTTMGVVYLPTAPTPNSGWVAIIPVQNIYDTELSVQEAMSMVLSGGIASPFEIELKPMDPREAIAFVEGGPEASQPQISPDSAMFELPFISRRDEDS